MPTTFQRCDDSVLDLAREIMQENACYGPILKAGVQIDFVFAFAETDENGETKTDALKKNRVKALGICRKISLKDRALGRGDAEIALDGNWWRNADYNEQKALLDHELFHIALKTDSVGAPRRDDLGRPVIGMRPHDYEFGWFREVAARNGAYSLERRQAATMMEMSGQYFWPAIAAATVEAA